MPDGDVRTANLQTFFQIVSDFENAGPKDLSRLLEFIDAAEQRGFISAGNERGSDGVTIMSIHKSKGLEFPVVFLCGLSRGFNMESTHAQVLCDKELGLGLGCFDAKLRVRYPSLAKVAISRKITRESISEELRVLYVAMTRARDRLIMTYAGRNLQKQLTEIAMRLDMSDPTLLALEADCPGAWVLQTALCRTEAGAFFALGGKPNCSRVTDIPWKIHVISEVTDSQAYVVGEETAQTSISREIYERISAILEFQYKNAEATKIPSKLTATQLKGRVLDTEISEGTASNTVVDFRRAGTDARLTGREYGNAIHAVMQYIRFSACSDLVSMKQDIQRMVTEQLISPEQAAAVDCGMLLKFFGSPLGMQLQSSNHVLREFKFSLLDDAAKYFPGAAGERVLLQGVVDCAMIEEDGITVLDFKTDRVTADTVMVAADKYKAQVTAYADALERIYNMPVKSAKLYFFALDQFVDII